jgi:branched-chain amino acid transport system ATP-binding protein
LHGVSLTVDDGEVVSLVGRNGAGRTTIIESIIGLLPVRSGNIKFRGQDITRLPPHKRAKCGIGYAPENSGIFPELTVGENLMISRWLSDKTVRGATQKVDAEAQALSVFPEVGKFLSRPGLNLSGGQKKMVSIARAMALAPSLMILDEAFEGLAPVVVKRFRDVARRIRGRACQSAISRRERQCLLGGEDRDPRARTGRILSTSLSGDAIPRRLSPPCRPCRCRADASGGRPSDVGIEDQGKRRARATRLVGAGQRLGC